MRTNDPYTTNPVFRLTCDNPIDEMLDNGNVFSIWMRLMNNIGMSVKKWKERIGEYSL